MSSESPAPAPQTDSLLRHLPLRGMALRVGSVTAFAVMAGLLKAASARGVSLPEIVFYRNAAALPVILAWLLMGPGLAAIKTRRPGAHLTRSLLGFNSMFCYFGALSLLPLAEAITLNYTAPIAATILSALFLREKVGPRRWAAVLIGFIGVVIIVRPGGDTALPLLGVGLGLLGALTLSMVTVTLRQISVTESTGAIVFWFTTFCVIVTGFMLPFYGQMHDTTTFLLLLAGGLCGGLGQLAMTGSLRFAPVAVVAPLDYVQIIWTVLIGWAFFATSPAIATLLGGALIAGSGIYTAYRERQRGKAISNTEPNAP
jgi:drug/metabolite transporter (DMT)-like permease